VDVGAKRGGQHHHATELELTGKFIKQIGVVGHVLQHFAADDGIEVGIAVVSLSISIRLVSQLLPCKPSSSVPAPPLCWKKSCDI
jgi:hypothetical protein